MKLLQSAILAVGEVNTNELTSFKNIVGVAVAMLAMWGFIEGALKIRSGWKEMDEHGRGMGTILAGVGLAAAIPTMVILYKVFGMSGSTPDNF